MCETLKIEIEAEDKEKLHTLLYHIFREITEVGHSENDIDGCSCLEDGIKWLVVKEGKFKGKYRWSTVEEIG
jgi:hypothetical protein